MPKKKERVWRIHRDHPYGYYAALHEGLLVTWRSLTTKDRARVKTWVAQAACHGTRQHTMSCRYCEEA